MDVKLCKNCKYLKWSVISLGRVCTNTKVSDFSINPVTGKEKWFYARCIDERGSDYGQCARGGNLFERK